MFLKTGAIIENNQIGTMPSDSSFEKLRLMNARVVGLSNVLPKVTVQNGRNSGTCDVKKQGKFFLCYTALLITSTYLCYLAFVQTCVMVIATSLQSFRMFAGAVLVTISSIAGFQRTPLRVLAKPVVIAGWSFFWRRLHPQPSFSGSISDVVSLCS